MSAERRDRLLTGTAALVAPGLHLLSDALEWLGGGFSPWQLSLSYAAFVPMPFVMVGLYAPQRSRVGWTGLLGALLYGTAFIYFAHTALYALVDGAPDYRTLVQKLGAVYTVHGVLMVVGGLAFGAAVLRARVLPRGTAIAFLAGVVLSLVFGLLPVPEIFQILGSAVRNVGLMGMGLAVLRGSTEL